LLTGAILHAKNRKRTAPVGRKVPEARKDLAGRGPETIRNPYWKRPRSATSSSTSIRSSPAGATELSQAHTRHAPAGYDAVDIQ